MPASNQISNTTVAWLFFVSGALALIYEALWQRRFSLIFGSSAPATAAVLAAYFAGLALGASLIGNRARRIQSPLKLYALLEIGIAAGALLVEVWLHFFTKFGGSSVFLKTLLAFVSLALPTICMGATLPALAAFVDRDEHHLGRTAGLLYVANTTGAAIGVLAVPILFLPILGGRNTLFLAALANVLIAVVALRLNRCIALQAPSPPSTSRPTRLARRLIILSFASGAIAFMVQILWNRAFAQIHENSLYTFTLIVAIFIAALAAGAQITRFLVRRGYNPEQLIAFAWITAGILLALSPFVFLALTKSLSYVSGSAKIAGLAALFIGPVATLIGIALPALFERAGANSAEPTRALGQLLTANLIGSVAGALVGGFVLPRVFGLWGGMIFTAGLLFFSTASFFPKLKLLFLAMIGLIVGIERADLTRVRLSNENEKVLQVAEGAHGIVAVTERGSSRRLKLNNSYVLGGTASTGDERMQSHIPLILHPNPERVAYLGLGTGISAGAATLHPIEQITLVELVPEVAAAARTHFADANLRIVEKPNARLVVEDARNFLRHTNEKFDVIIGDLVVPWRAGESALFTVENFRAAKSALASRGLYCQWVPLFQVSEDEFRIILNTFLSVFPEAYLWRADFSPHETALALVGFADGATFDAEMIRRRLSQLSRDPANPHLMDDFAVWMHFVGRITPVEINPRYLMNSEDRPWLELQGAPGESAFAGRRFQQWSHELNAVSFSRFNAGEREAVAVHAGAMLFDFTLLFSERNRSAALAVAAELRPLLPPNLAPMLLPP